MVNTVKDVREIVNKWIDIHLHEYSNKISQGLPEIDDRYNLWRVSLVVKNGASSSIGEVKVSMNGEIAEHTEVGLLVKRLKKFIDQKEIVREKIAGLFYPAPIPNKVILGDAAIVLDEFPPDTAQLIITSPPYFNAKPQYSEYIDYQEYLDFLRKVFVRCHTILSEGRFFIINVSPVLIRRTSRSNSSKRIPIPFDIHRIMDTTGFEFIDDIIWVKPEGAGWNTGRGRRFAADRQPLQYKPVPVTEYVLVYRKKTNKLIDWNIRKHHDKRLVEESKIKGQYDITNVWHIPPGHHKDHPAVFPNELIRRLIKYYSFIDDLVLDPFAGSGTIGRVSIEMERRFLLIENNPRFFKAMKKELISLSSNLIRNVRVDFDINEGFKGDSNGD
ncbi:MAG: site-specific DNA-methyltransferase [Planctomycetes bacterium]|nr:site-specific DNA-methyltransferase [Planctomycetota bacterium]MBM4064253.1 site-specific DNA-methyltransferase [Planctomycetota bacterium]